MMEEKAVKTVKICGQENLNKIKTLKESNIEIFKKKLSEQIIIEVQNNDSEKIDEVILLLELFFEEKEEKKMDLIQEE